MARRPKSDLAPGLPPLLAEIASVVGAEAMWALVGSKGGQSVFIPPNINQGHWLALAIGLEKAREISAHFCGEGTGVHVTIPVGRLYHSKLALIKAIEEGATANAAAAASGMHVRSAFRVRARQKALRAAGQRSLFDDDNSSD